MKRRVFITIISLILSTLYIVPSFATDCDEGYISRKSIIDTNRGYVSLENCDGEYIFTNPKEIALIANKYGLEDSSDITEIRYIPIPETEDIIQQDSETSNAKKSPASTQYYIKKKQTYESKGELIRSSWYEYPGGSMSISESVKREKSYNITSGIKVSSDIVESTLSASYGISFSKTDKVTDNQKVSVNKNCKRNIKAYVNRRKYTGELWRKWLRKGDWAHEKCGNITVTRGIGVIFAIGKNVGL